MAPESAVRKSSLPTGTTQSGGEKNPVIVVSGGHRIPIRARAGSPDEKRLAVNAFTSGARSEQRRAPNCGGMGSPTRSMRSKPTSRTARNHAFYNARRCPERGQDEPNQNRAIRCLRKRLHRAVGSADKAVSIGFRSARSSVTGRSKSLPKVSAGCATYPPMGCMTVTVAPRWSMRS